MNGIFLFDEKVFCSQDITFCVFDESTSFKIYEVFIDITPH